MGCIRSSKFEDGRSFHLRKMVQIRAPPPIHPAMTASVVMAPFERVLDEVAALAVADEVGLALTETWLVIVTAPAELSWAAIAAAVVWDAAAVVGAAVVDVGAAEVDEEDEVVDEEVVDEAVEEVVEALEWRFSTLTPQQQKIII